MKLGGARKVHYESGPDMTPLVDVVMVLLIFMMLVGKFSGVNRYLVSDMPISDQGQSSSETPPSLDTPLEINVVSPDVDKFIASFGKNQSSDPDQLSGMLASQFKAMTQATKPDKIQVFIKPGANVQYRHIIRVYTAVMRAGFVKIGFKTSGG